jgi:uncharacterized protein YqjF (DUF2071 family)
MTNTTPTRFLTARWERLLMLNYEIDPALLRDRVPVGTELDLWDGRCFVSMVGFHFLDTRVLGIAVPFHRDFLEVNLRFYVKRDTGSEVRRGVVFVKEIVPRLALALVANVVYNENYIALPMAFAESEQALSYAWTHRGERCELKATRQGDPSLPGEGSEEQFITEHYWGYASQRDGSTMEYQVEHPPWRVTRGVDGVLTGDVSRLYGAELAPLLKGAPSSCFIAEGSPIVVRRGVRLAQ